MVARYAIYYAPPRASALWRFGTTWLGRDPEGPSVDPRPSLPGIPPGRVAEIIAEPARYGFHATLKPPFGLRPGRGPSDLLVALDRFGEAERSFDAPALALRTIGRFIALVPASTAPSLHAFASRVVEAFDDFRAPPTEAELARRQPDKLSARQQALLARWGYPYVFDEFRFHLTLTGNLAQDEERDRMVEVLSPLVAPLCRDPITVTEIALFREPAPGAPFVLERRFPLQRRAG